MNHPVTIVTIRIIIPGMRAAVDFTIVRLAATERLCTTNTSVAPYLPERRDQPTLAESDGSEPLPNRLCPMRGTVGCKWRSLRCSVDTDRAQ